MSPHDDDVKIYSSRLSTDDKIHATYVFQIKQSKDLDKIQLQLEMLKKQLDEIFWKLDERNDSD